MVVPDYQIADFGNLIRNGWPDLDPRRTVLLEQPLPMLPRSADSKAVAGSARIQRYATTEIDLEADAPDGGFLVLNDVWHPWWRAELDGHPPEILKANVLFRAVRVGPGIHRVRFAFEPLQGAWEELKEKVAGVGDTR